MINNNPIPNVMSTKQNNQSKLPNIPSPSPLWCRNIICPCIGKYQGDSNALKNGYHMKLEGPRQLQPPSGGQHLSLPRASP